MLIKLLFYLLFLSISVTQINSKSLWFNNRDDYLREKEILRNFINNGDRTKPTSEKFTLGEKDTIKVNAKHAYDKKHTNKVKKIDYVDTDEINNGNYSIGHELSKKKQDKIRGNSDILQFNFPEEIEIRLKELDLNKNNDLIIRPYAKEETKLPFDYQDKEKIRWFAENKNEDIAVFNFCDDIWKDKKSNKQVSKSTGNRNNVLNDKLKVRDIPLNVNKNATEHICTYLKITKCSELNGLIYSPRASISIKSINEFLICCILSLPTQNTISNSVGGPLKRYRRSNKEISALKQREHLFRRKYGSQSTQPTVSLKKIVTPDDDFVDPYWNIKNSNLKSLNKQGVVKQEYYQDYVEDYVVELPTPGLVGLYSDNGKEPSRWVNEDDNPNPSYGDSNDYSEESVGVSFGYSTIDPRRVTPSKTQKRRPVKLTTELPEEETFDIESQTVNFQSNPNFQVLQGFKILNLGRNKNKHMKNVKRSTTESSVEYDSTERDGEQQVFRNCGKTSNSERESGIREIGEAEAASHPWLAVVVSSRQPQNVLCYVTIIHPRGAITAADCVSNYTKRTPGNDVIVIAGLREVKERSEGQNRIATVQINPQWKRGHLAHNLAILHWIRPLRLNAHVQPACLSSFHDQEDCKFYGWGGFDQAMHHRVRWQKAVVISPQECTSRFLKTTKLPGGAFCATVKARGTVTGIGGSLICNVDGYATSIGVAVYRDKAVVLVSAHAWILRAMEDLNIK